MAEVLVQKLMAELKEEMVCPTGGEPTVRIAHFLTPSVTSIDGPVFDLPPNTCFPGATSSFAAILKKSNLKVNFCGWRNPQKDWKTWVDRMSSLHRAAWRKAGIFDAIMNSTYLITRNEDLIFSFGEKWCPDTNTFVFPWGEATITLEDMMILGGYSVLGDPVFRPVDTDEFAEVEKKLLLARSGLAKSKSKKPSQSLWLTKFMDSGNEIEHEAFLALWLSRFVFPNKTSDDTVQKIVIPIAIHLARGTKIALAPAILANLYASLSELKQALVDSRRMQNVNEQDKILELLISAPFQLVQIWILERFLTLLPKPVTLEHGQPRFAKWSGLRMEDMIDVSLSIDEAADFFLWRPYAIGCKNSLPHYIYKEKEHWVLVGSDMDEDLEALVRCLRVSELVGIESDCIMQYLPHRVAMQFGFDQGLPGQVTRANLNISLAWENYTRTVRDERLYIPSRLFEPDVTTQYLVWWRKSMSVHLAASVDSVTGARYKGLKKQLLLKSSQKKSASGAPASASLPRMCETVRPNDSEKKAIADKESAQTSSEKESDNISLVPPGFPPKPNQTGTSNSEDADHQIQAKRLKEGADGNHKAQNIIRMTGAQYKKYIADRVKSSGKRVQLKSDKKKPNNNEVVTPGFPTKGNILGKRELEDEDGHTRVKRLRKVTDVSGKTENVVILTGSEYKAMLLNTAGRKSDNHGSLPLDFSPKHNTVGAKGSVDRNGCVQFESLGNNANGKDKSQRDSQLEGPISSISENITVQKMQVEPSEIKLETEMEKRSSRMALAHETETTPDVYLTGRLVGCGSRHKCEGSETQPFCHLPAGPSLPNLIKDSSEAGAVIHEMFGVDKGNGKSCSHEAWDVLAWKLEARIRNIESTISRYRGGL
ncbi:uncharacterized protein [Coffea arabica]|uniref:Aminotransferase-like plant mobile domain-containing protein n=1 Tax=Coffea arabica TaxID=13443 RepID=A0ABM4UGB9_COFAR